MTGIGIMGGDEPKKHEKGLFGTKKHEPCCAKNPIVTPSSHPAYSRHYCHANYIPTKRILSNLYFFLAMPFPASCGGTVLPSHIPLTPSGLGGVLRGGFITCSHSLFLRGTGHGNRSKYTIWTIKFGSSRTMHNVQH